MSKIAVDVTPLLPGGINGGAKPMVVALLQEMPRLLAEDEFILWTADYSHDELAFLDRPNLKRVCVHFDGTKSPETQSMGYKWLIKKGWDLVKHLLPQRIQQILRASYYHNKILPIASSSLYKNEKVDFLFCPFGAPRFYNPNVLTLSIIYDLQFIDHPDFFTEQERFYRQLHFDQICQLADHIVTISEFTRQSVLKKSSMLPEQVTTIHIGLVHDYQASANLDEEKKTLEKLGLKPKHYLFYPANFWAHKNHKALLQGFQIFLKKHPASDIKLVFTGALDDRKAATIADAERMGLQDFIVAPGFLADQEVGTLYRNAKGLIFPSLYEGFGIPLLEAMQAEIPIACSQVTSLPEIGKDAVLYFDPKDIHEIDQAIEVLSFNSARCEELVQKGRERLQAFGDAQTLAKKYGNLIHRMLGSNKKIVSYGLHGMTEDRWFQEKAYLKFPSSGQGRNLEFSFQSPEWMPGKLEVVFTESANQIAVYHLNHENSLHESFELPRSSGIIEIHFSTTYTPAGLGISNDHRPLSALCELFQIKSFEGTILFDALPQK